MYFAKKSNLGILHFSGDLVFPQGNLGGTCQKALFMHWSRKYLHFFIFLVIFIDLQVY